MFIFVDGRASITSTYSWSFDLSHMSSRTRTFLSFLRTRSSWPIAPNPAMAVTGLGQGRNQEEVSSTQMISFELKIKCLNLGCCSSE